MKTLKNLILVAVACACLGGCGGPQQTSVSEDLTEADIQNYEEKLKQEEAETAAGL